MGIKNRNNNLLKTKIVQLTRYVSVLFNTKDFKQNVRLKVKITGRDLVVRLLNRTVEHQLFIL